jgi:hypothetical protein
MAASSGSWKDQLQVKDEDVETVFFRLLKLCLTGGPGGGKTTAQVNQSGGNYGLLG